MQERYGPTIKYQRAPSPTRKKITAPIRNKTENASMIQVFQVQGWYLSSAFAKNFVVMIGVPGCDPEGKAEQPLDGRILSELSLGPSYVGFSRPALC